MERQGITKLEKIVVPGTFDPITNGHLDVIRRACKLSPQVVVAVAESQLKKGARCFSLEERLELVRAVTKDMPEVIVMPFSSLLVQFCQKIGAQAVVKGLRALTDFEYEFQQAGMNFHLDESLESIFVMTHPRYAYISSSLVKELCVFGAPVSDLVPPVVEAALHEKFPVQK